jgi:hypothetical protein
VPRFDLGDVCKFQSPFGGLSTGGLIRNGFIEPGTAGPWVWPRPALSLRQATPATGTALGLVVVGTALYGILHNGTATSYTVNA